MTSLAKPPEGAIYGRLAADVGTGVGTSCLERTNSLIFHVWVAEGMTGAAGTRAQRSEHGEDGEARTFPGASTAALTRIRLALGLCPLQTPLRSEGGSPRVHA